ncbi:MAG: flagellar biosynthetic protein FliR [Myxococcales bacterium]|nr:flagellar biosynthetic protein FliR [Myxococcales bacterium]
MDGLVPLLLTFVLVFARVASLTAVVPVFALTGVPKWVPPLLSLVIAALIAPHVDAVDPGGRVSVLFTGLLCEGLLGAVSGLGVAAVYSAMAMAADVAASQTAMAFSTMFDPFTRAQESTLGTLASLLAGACFVGLGLHDRVLIAVARSFEIVPAGVIGAPTHATPQLIALVEATLQLGVELATPVVAVVWLVNLFVALLARLAPRMNAFFAIGTTLTGSVGMLMFAVSIPWMLTVHTAAVRDVVDAVVGLLGAR